jgi:nitrate reductase NapA
VGCGLLVGVQGGRAVAVRGDPESPVSRGLACARGYHSVQALYGKDRLTRALVRRNGVLAPAPMGEALDLVARRIRETIERHGPDSIAMYGSAQWSATDAYIAAKFLKGALGTNNLDTNERLHAASATAGLEGTYGLPGAVGTYEDLDRADVFVLWNLNVAETDPVLFSRMLARRQSNPAVRIIALSTRATRTTYAADETILYAPHAEPVIANAICQDIVARQAANREFVERHVTFWRGREGLGDGLADEAIAPDGERAVTWSDYVAFLSDYAPDRAARLSGVPAETLRWLGSLYADPARSVVTGWGSAVNQHPRGTWLNNLLHNIHLLVGKVARPGNGAICLSGQPSSGLLHGAGAAPHALPAGRVSLASDRRRAARIWGVPEERVNARPGRSAISMFRALERGDIRFLWVQASNPMVSLPNLVRYQRALAAEDRFLVVSEVYPTATTDMADVVLPAAMWLEREGVQVNAERRAQHVPRLVSPPGDATSDGWQVIEVARRLGHGTLFPWARESHVEQAWEEYRGFMDGNAQALPSLGELRSRPGVTWPWVNGRETRCRYNTALDPAADRARGDVDFYGHEDHRARIWLRPHESPAESPDRRYPFWFTTGGVLEHWGTGSLTRRIPALHRAAPRAYVEIHRDDARALGIVDGERVRLVSRRGSVEVEARLDYRGQPARGVLFAPSFDEAVRVNRLTLDACDPASGQPAYGACAVRVERLQGGGRP